MVARRRRENGTSRRAEEDESVRGGVKCQDPVKLGTALIVLVQVYCSPCNLSPTALWQVELDRPKKPSNNSAAINAAGCRDRSNIELLFCRYAPTPISGVRVIPKREGRVDLDATPTNHNTNNKCNLLSNHTVTTIPRHLNTSRKNLRWRPLDRLIHCLLDLDSPDSVLSFPFPRNPPLACHSRREDLCRRLMPLIGRGHKLSLWFPSLVPNQVKCHG